MDELTRQSCDLRWTRLAVPVGGNYEEPLDANGAVGNDKDLFSCALEWAKCRA